MKDKCENNSQMIKYCENHIYTFVHYFSLINVMFISIRTLIRSYTITTLLFVFDDGFQMCFLLHNL